MTAEEYRTTASPTPSLRPAFPRAERHTPKLPLHDFTAPETGRPGSSLPESPRPPAPDPAAWPPAQRPTPPQGHGETVPGGVAAGPRPSSRTRFPPLPQEAAEPVGPRCAPAPVEEVTPWRIAGRC